MKRISSKGFFLIFAGIGIMWFGIKSSQTVTNYNPIFPIAAGLICIIGGVGSYLNLGTTTTERKSEKPLHGLVLLIPFILILASSNVFSTFLPTTENSLEHDPKIQAKLEKLLQGPNPREMNYQYKNMSLWELYYIRWRHDGENVVVSASVDSWTEIPPYIKCVGLYFCGPTCGGHPLLLFVYALPSYSDFTDSEKQILSETSISDEITLYGVFFLDHKDQPCLAYHYLI